MKYNNFMSWNSFKDVAKYKVEKSSTWQQAQELVLLKKANDLLTLWFGEKVASQAQAVLLYQGVLSIAVLVPQIQTDLQARQEEFLALLNKDEEQRMVWNLRFLA